MSSGDDRVRLQHMLEAAQNARRFVQGRTRADLDRDPMLVMAVMKSVEIIGEASTRISPETRAALAHLPWAQMSGIRNRLVHVYFDINLDTLWETVVQELPPLIEALERAVDEESRS